MKRVIVTTAIAAGTITKAYITKKSAPKLAERFHIEWSAIAANRPASGASPFTHDLSDSRDAPRPIPIMLVKSG